MTSADNTLDMTKLELLLREHFARTEKQLSDMRKDNAEFRSLMLKEFNAFEEKINTRVDKLEATVAVMQNDIIGLNRNVELIRCWDRWLLLLVIVVLALPHIATGIKSLFTAIAEGISLIVNAFRQGDKSQ